MNITTLTGTLVSEPNTGATPHGPVTSVRIAFHTSRPGVGRGYVDVVAYDVLASVLAGLDRGARIVLAGELGFEEWGPRGQRRTRNVVRASELYHVGQEPTGPRR